MSHPDPSGATPHPVASSFARDLAGLASGTAVYQGCRFALTIAAAALLGPAEFGMWTLLIVLLSYAGSLSLGVPNGLGREVPFLIGARRPAEAADLEDAAWAASIAMGALAALVAAPVAALVVGDHPHATLLVVATMAAVFLQQPWLLSQIQLRSRMLFRAASLQLAVQGILALAGGLALLRGGVAGLWASQSLVLLAGIGMAVRALTRTPRPRLRAEPLRRLATIGFPVMLAGLLFGLLTTVDRWFVAGTLGEAAVGHYGLVGLALSALLMIPTIVSQQVYPQMSFALGQGADRRALVDRATRTGAMSAALVGAAAIALAIVAVLAIPAFLPAYEPSIVPMLVLLPCLVVYAGGATHADLLNAIGAHWIYLGIQAAAVVLNIALLVLLLGAGFGLGGAAAATSIAVGTYAVALVVAARWAVNRRQRQTSERVPAGPVGGASGARATDARTPVTRADPP